MAHKGRALAVAVHTGIGDAESFLDSPENVRPHLDLADVGALTRLLAVADTSVQSAGVYRDRATCGFRACSSRQATSGRHVRQVFSSSPPGVIRRSLLRGDTWVGGVAGGGPAGRAVAGRRRRGSRPWPPRSEPPPAQIGLAWLLAEGDDIAPIPGTRRVARVEENTVADAITLSTGQFARLDNLIPASGERHDENNMAAVDPLNRVCRWRRRELPQPH